MNLPLLSQGMHSIIIGFCFCLFFAGVTIYLTKYRFKKPNARKWRIITAMVLLGIILAYIIFYTVSNMIGRAQVKARLAQMKKLGIPLASEATIPDLPKNSSENGAFFYRAAFALLDAEDSCLKIYGIYQAQRYNNNVAEWSEAGVKRAKQLLNNKHMNLVFSLFSRGAEKPYAVYIREYRGPETLFPELNYYRSMFRLIAMKSSCDGLDGKVDAGYELIRDGYKSIIQFNDDPGLISQLVNISCVAINIDALNALVSKYGISNTRAKEFIRLIDKLDCNQTMKHQVDGEAVLFDKYIYEGIMNGKYTLQELEKLVSFSKSKYIDLLAPIWPFFYQDYAYALKRKLEIRAFFDKPYWQVKQKVKNWQAQVQSRPFMFIAEGMMSAFGALRIKTARINTEIDAMKLTLALHIFKNKNGHFPEKIEELSPFILKNLPLDPMSGKPFGYKKQGNYFTLNSVWLNEKRQREQKRQKRRK